MTIGRKELHLKLLLPDSNFGFCEKKGRKKENGVCLRL